MWLCGEYGEPHVERNGGEGIAHEGQSGNCLAPGKILQDDNRTGRQCQDKPDIEIEKEITKIEIEWLGPENIWTTSRTTEYVIEDKLPRYNNDLVVEESINGNLECLKMSACSFPQGQENFCVTRAIAHRTVPSRNLRPTSTKSLVIDAKTNSSAMNGATKAAANGQPIMPAMPNHMIPSLVFDPPRQSKKADIPNITMYMEKLDGRYAAEA